jgi:HemY protein
MEDWEALHRLMPALHNNKVLMEAEIKLLEMETHSALLKRRAASGNPTEIRELWGRMPQHIRQMTGIESLYFAAMIDAGAGLEVEEELRLAIGRDWNETLLVLYGCIQMADTEKQLQHAEAWLAPHPKDPVLLRVLGKLALRIGHGQKGQEYLQRSLDAEPSAEAFQLMGDLLAGRQDLAGASDCYRKGLQFVSRQVVAQVEQAPKGEPADPPQGLAAAS